MKDRQFVEAVFGELFEKNLVQYKDSLLAPVKSDGDSYGRARGALALLNASQKNDVLDFLKVVIADSASVVFGVLDGVHFPDGLEGDFVLSCDGEEIQGDLQDIFIEKALEQNVYD